jgi:propionate CoA-transferase
MSVPVESPSSTSVTDEVVTTARVVLRAESLSGGTEVRDKVVVEGFVGQCFAEELTLALEQRFLLTGTPQDLNLVFTVAPGDRQGPAGSRRPDQRAVGGHWGLSPPLGKMAVGNIVGRGSDVDRSGRCACKRGLIRVRCACLCAAEQIREGSPRRWRCR